MSSEEGIIKYETPDWVKGIDMEELEKLSAIGYTIQQLALYFQVNERIFLAEFMRNDSPLQYHYNRGILMYSAQEGMTMLTDAAGGNTTQGQRLDKLRRSLKIEQIKREMIYGD